MLWDAAFPEHQEPSRWIPVTIHPKDLSKQTNACTDESNPSTNPRYLRPKGPFLYTSPHELHDPPSPGFYIFIVFVSSVAGPTSKEEGRCDHHQPRRPHLPCRHHRARAGHPGHRGLWRCYGPRQQRPEEWAEQQQSTMETGEMEDGSMVPKGSGHDIQDGRIHES